MEKTRSIRTYKAVTEAKYLSVENAHRYRAILRYFYEEQQRLRYWLRPEEILQAVKERIEPSDASSYNEDLLQLDLQQLHDWGNLQRKQSGKVNKIEDFKKKRYRYQATPYTIKFERLIEDLEEMGDAYGGSLEVTQFEKLVETLRWLTRLARVSFHRPGERPRYEMEDWSNEKLYDWWTELYEQFRKVTNNARDYMASLDSVQVEDAMMTEQFLLYKDKVTDYLRRFMMGLQRSSYQIEGLLVQVDRRLLQDLLHRVASYEVSIPRFEQTAWTKEDYTARFFEQWEGIWHWFLGDGSGRGSDLEDLQRETNEAIRRIARYAQRMGERQSSMRSRRADYLYLAKWFASHEEVEPAHCLSAAVFGITEMHHFWVEGPKSTEDIYCEIWDMSASDYDVKPRINGYRERTRPSKIDTKDEQKEAMLAAYLQQKAQRQSRLNELFAADRVSLRDLPIVEPFVRQTLLGWIGKSMASPAREGKTDDGRRFRLTETGTGERIRLQCTDGVLELPDFVLYFLDESKVKR
ncbi:MULTISPECIES: TIGR02677 family protein [Brevibacillus]|uniref:TIGR02677 family protein n=1 Tax=Brevibacillus panacihumi TaxID=497735 RepID=A0A3M8D455_9BACL|nr:MULTISPECIES: TIGR02677 family protein [Brevibacillus]MBY0055156.1 TIGR02677 family protein [Brevibacillus agri]RNB82856.1 TIGR02677 family protein [Brevibacillus panacihumi]